MGLDELCDLISVGLPVDCQICLAELLGHSRSDHMDSEQTTTSAIRSLLSDDLHHALWVAQDECPPVTGIAMLAHDDIKASFFR